MIWLHFNEIDMNLISVLSSTTIDLNESTHHATHRAHMFDHFDRHLYELRRWTTDNSATKIPKRPHCASRVYGCLSIGLCDAVDARLTVMMETCWFFHFSDSAFQLSTFRKNRCLRMLRCSSFRLLTRSVVRWSSSQIRMNEWMNSPSLVKHVSNTL